MQPDIGEQKLYEIVKRVVSEHIDDGLDKPRNEIRLAALYNEFAKEDQQLAEEGLADYSEGLKKEDVS